MRGRKYMSPGQRFGLALGGLFFGVLAVMGFSTSPTGELLVLSICSAAFAFFGLKAALRGYDEV